MGFWLGRIAGSVIGEPICLLWVMGVLRNGFVDYTRLIAAFAIVWFHSQAPGNRIAYLAMPFFLVLLAMPSRSGLQNRAARLLLPFIVWSAIYGLVQVAQSLANHRPPFDWFHPRMLLMGTEIHLWFLPFALLVAVVSPALRRPIPALIAPVATSALVGLITVSLDPPWAQWAFGVVPVLVGLAYVAAGKTALISLAVSTVILFALRDNADNLTIALGTGLALLALSIHLQPTAISAWCARVSLTVYLSHMLFLIIGTYVGLGGYALAFFGIVGSLVFGASLDFSQRRRAASVAAAGP